ncbi:DNA replication regulator sld2 [Mycena venus]|uniref:DNA replication regulator SLD2 n=1 Tax=Mycena venus TaxID=2733690 RepID=A0A8H7CTM3_9AGAR|nr:DNA replication regulator sld2 [Mycena venus]
MVDVATLKTEIKTWERSFRASHGREPSVQDIKKQPELAEKYKLYKKLTKAAEPTQSTKPSNPPFHASKGSPLSGYNPFSPQKNKGKQKELSPDPYSRSNPFQITRDPSPVPFPPLSSASASATTSDPFAPTPNNAVSRARKRLRGEPVSPSPNKEKRRRMTAPEEESDEDDELGAADTSFVDDSPAKPPTGVRSFKLLFDEGSAKPKLPSLLRSKTAPSGLFGNSAPRTESSENMDIDEVVSKSIEKLAPNNTSSAGQQDDPFVESPKGTVITLDEEMVDDRPLPPDAAARSLLAPSPPPATRRPSGQPHLQNGKGKSNPTSKGKNKVEVLSEEEEGSDEDAPIDGKKSRHKVRLFERTASRRRLHDGDDLDEDTLHFMTRLAPDTDVVQPEETSESISLPDTLLSILSLAPASSHGRQDEHVVEQLLYGARRGNYDPSKGGEIWGVGEFEEEERDEFAVENGTRRATRGVYDDEDDWEGEGVPWEVGEL